jgi:Bacteriophage replication gene A protein (GPA)
MNLNVRKFLSTPVKQHQTEYLNTHLAKLPNLWAAEVQENYWRLVNAETEKQANEYLRKVTDPLRGLLDIAADDGDLKQLADALASKVRERKSWLPLEFAEFAHGLCEAYCVTYPMDDDAEGVINRLVCQVWWLRNLRNSHAKAREIAAIDAGIVHAKKNVYVSDDTLERRGQQLRRNANMLEGVTLESESGQRMQLDTIAAAGMSNPDNRRAELMTRITGFEELANKYGHKAVFVTVTCPSKMHAVLKSGQANPKYDGTKPDDAQKYLVKTWAQCRAKLARLGLKFYGLRVAEPHHDATPHWHMIFFFNDKDRGNLVSEIRTYFLREDWTEAGASENRVKFVHIKPSKGTAAGYVVKYVSKNIGGIDGESSDEAKASSNSLAGRVEAWASTWRIRQFQQIGGHSVTVWRELRRVSCELAQQAGAQIFNSWYTAQRKDTIKASFAEYIESMGGLNTPPTKGWVKLDDDFIYTRGRYGMGIVHKVRGVCERYGMGAAKNNREEWQRV